MRCIRNQFEQFNEHDERRTEVMPKFNLILINEAIVIAEQSGFFFLTSILLFTFIYICFCVRAWLEKSIKMYNECEKVGPIQEKNIYIGV